MFFFVWILIPETKGMSLERMDDLFGVTEIAKAIGDEETGHGGPATESRDKQLPQVQKTTTDAIEHEKGANAAVGKADHMEEVQL